jgi:hypothetical protein
LPDEDVTMSLQFHPRMQADGTLSPSQEESPEGTPAEATPPTPPETPTAPAEPTAPSAPIGEDDGFIRISKTDPYDDIRRAAQADPEFNRRVREFAGRENRRTYEEELTRLRAENAQKDRELRRREIVAMTPEEREEKFRTDPEFARAYTETIHPPEEDDDSDPVIQSEASYYEDTRDSLFDDARDAKMPPWRIKQFEEAFHSCPVHKTNEHGFYDHDASGKFFDETYKNSPELARKASFDFFQRTLNAELRQVQAAVASAAQQPPAKTEPSAPPPEAPADASQASGGAGAPNAALQRSSPDVSPRSNGGGAPVRYTNEDLQAMGVDKRIELVESLGGRKKMIEDGTLYVPGLSERVHGQALPR